jgi:hypothetical protein
VTADLEIKRMNYIAAAIIGMPILGNLSMFSFIYDSLD